MMAIAYPVVPMERFDIPVLIDAIDREHPAPLGMMARAMYWVVSADELPPEWRILAISTGDPPRRFELLQMGGSSLLFRSRQPDGLFHSAADIQELFEMFDAQEERPDLWPGGSLIEIEDVWLPQTWLHPNVKRGDVYRVPLQGFLTAFRYRTGLGAFSPLDPPPGLRISEPETAAFAAWFELQVDEARRFYAAHEAIALGYRDEDEGATDA